MMTTHEQQTQNGFSIGWLTLNLPQTLNALTLDMATAAIEQLRLWAARPDIACVVLQGEGRAFCAGGDVRRMRTGILAADDYCERFFEQEYRLDYTLHNYPKPLLAWGHGVVMGGGLGLLMGASHRVVTESTRMAMPEINIGLYPDVGASFFLNRLPQGLGLFLGITGCEWNSADAIALGMADHLLDDSGKSMLPDLLATQSWAADSTHNRGILSQSLQQLPRAAVKPQLTRYTNLIANACHGTLQQTITALESLDINEIWFERALANLTHGCPVTVCIVAEQLQRSQGMSLADVFRMEWIVSIQCTRHPDFPEGVRAQLVDKDKNPRWQFTSINSVPQAYITNHFVMPSGFANPLGNLG
ncbi:MAG TPA: enoyl-CoA hydratase/isomerase family protein [Pseudomonadales bacterium]|nr:enoyl-CoA hydratase/isomerase family protein [Pseudomonadales bacterium]